MKSLLAMGLPVLCAVEFSTAASAAPVVITFNLQRIKEVECGDGFGEACPDDYFAFVNIDNQGAERRDSCHDSCCTDCPVNWSFTRTVDSSHNPIPIHIEVWDQDDLSDDEEIDIANGPNTLDLAFSLTSCTFQGGGLTTAQGAGVVNGQGESHGGGDGFPESRAFPASERLRESCPGVARATRSEG